MKFNQNVKKSLYNGIRPHQWLTNISISYFQEQQDFVAPSVFPVVPVQKSSGKYPIFSREDLARDDVHEKPEFGHVNPAVLSTEKGEYDCRVDQIIMGIDSIQQVNNQRSSLPGSIDPRIGMSRAVAEKISIHLDDLFANKYFHEGAWSNELTGDSSEDLDGEKKFIKFSDANCEPIKLIHKLNNLALRKTRRRYNTMLLGVDAYDALINHPDIIDRIKMGGTTANPAIVTENVLAQLFGLNTVKQVGSTINRAAIGAEEDMQFICDPKAVLLAHVAPNPAIDTPSAGYIFSWDATGNGRPINIESYPGRPEDHAEFIEGLCAFDIAKVCDDLGLFMKDAC